jgi:hypothetical protein
MRLEATTGRLSSRAQSRDLVFAYQSKAKPLPPLCDEVDCFRAVAKPELAKPTQSRLGFTHVLADMNLGAVFSRASCVIISLLESLYPLGDPLP